MKYYKILNGDRKHWHIKRQDGKTVRQNEIQYKKGHNSSLGEEEISFTDALHIIQWMDTLQMDVYETKDAGTLIAEVEFPEGETYVEVFQGCYKAQNIILKSIRPLCSVEVFSDLLKEYPDIFKDCFPEIRRIIGENGSIEMYELLKKQDIPAILQANQIVNTGAITSKYALKYHATKFQQTEFLKYLEADTFWEDLQKEWSESLNATDYETEDKELETGFFPTWKRRCSNFFRKLSQ